MSQDELNVEGDFNGLFGDILCLSHHETTTTRNGAVVKLSEGMKLTAWQEDFEDGKRDDLFASGTVERAPESLKRHGSMWVLRIDHHGVRHQSDLNQDESNGI